MFSLCARRVLGFVRNLCKVLLSSRLRLALCLLTEFFFSFVVRKCCLFWEVYSFAALQEVLPHISCSHWLSTSCPVGREKVQKSSHSSCEQAQYTRWTFFIKTFINTHLYRQSERELSHFCQSFLASFFFRSRETESTCPDRSSFSKIKLPQKACSESKIVEEVAVMDSPGFSN